MGYQERYEDFSDFGSTERPKFFVRWQPIDLALTLRATYDEGSHAPTLSQLFGGPSQSFVNINDPLHLTTEPQVEQRLSGNPNLQQEPAYEWTYGGVVTPGRWWSPLQGLTLSADFYHIDLRGVTVVLDPQFLVDHESQFPGQVIRDPAAGDAIVLLLTPEQNLGRIIEEGWDYEAVYSLDTSRLGHGDWGIVTLTLNGTYVNRIELQVAPGGPEQSVVGKFGGGFLGPSAGGSFTHNRCYASLFYNGPQNSWLGGVDTGFTVNYIGQDRDTKGFETTHNGQEENRKIREWITVDWLLNYTFNFAVTAANAEIAGYAKDGGENAKSRESKDKNVGPVSTADYNRCGWRAWLNHTTITLGVNNVFNEEPPFVAAAFENGYDESTANIKGRTWYVALKKRF